MSVVGNGILCLEIYVIKFTPIELTVSTIFRFLSKIDRNPGKKSQDRSDHPNTVGQREPKKDSGFGRSRFVLGVCKFVHSFKSDVTGKIDLIMCRVYYHRRPLTCTQVTQYIPF